jgi:hypothetical protein
MVCKSSSEARARTQCYFTQAMGQGPVFLAILDPDKNHREGFPSDPRRPTTLHKQYDIPNPHMQDAPNPY